VRSDTFGAVARERDNARYKRKALSFLWAARVSAALRGACLLKLQSSWMDRGTRRDARRKEAKVLQLRSSYSWQGVRKRRSLGLLLRDLQSHYDRDVRSVAQAIVLAGMLKVKPLGKRK
jgi:hypothetical protein